MTQQLIPLPMRISVPRIGRHVRLEMLASPQGGSLQAAGDFDALAEATPCG